MKSSPSTISATRLSGTATRSSYVARRGAALISVRARLARERPRTHPHPAWADAFRRERFVAARVSAPSGAILYRGGVARRQPPAPHLRVAATPTGRVTRLRAAPARPRVDPADRRHVREVAADGNKTAVDALDSPSEQSGEQTRVTRARATKQFKSEEPPSGVEPATNFGRPARGASDERDSSE